jgi:RNA polymerase sigma-70 factor (ECF subfamily)
MIGPQAPRLFQTTRWSVVRRSVSEDPAEAEAALAQLCEAYWYPLYAYVRRSGLSPQDAEDVTQSFFAHLLSRDVIAGAVPEKGRLRSFLLSCARNFLADRIARARAQKRGAGQATLSFDAMQAEERYAAEPVDDLSPDRLFQRRWALAVLETTLARLGAAYEEEGKGAIFARVRPFLGFGAEPELRYEQVGAALGMTIGTVKSHVFRMRQRWRELLFEEVAATLDEPTEEEIKAELAELVGCV